MLAENVTTNTGDQSTHEDRRPIDNKNFNLKSKDSELTIQVGAKKLASPSEINMLRESRANLSLEQSPISKVSHNALNNISSVRKNLQSINLPLNSGDLFQQSTQSLQHGQSMTIDIEKPFVKVPDPMERINKKKAEKKKAALKKSHDMSAQLEVARDEVLAGLKM